MLSPSISIAQIKKLISKGAKLPLATKNYPSRGQTAVQDLYQTSKGKLFLKKSSKQNHIDCQIAVAAGTLAEREYWAFRLAQRIGLEIPSLWLTGDFTTVQIWLDLPDAHVFATTQGKMELTADDVFNCALFDWVTGQIDRHDANYLYNYVQKKIILIDSAHCFLKYAGSIPDYLRYFEIGYPKELKGIRSTAISKTLKKLSRKDLLKLIPLRHADEQNALLQRHDQIQRVSTLQDALQLYRETRI